MFESYSFNKTYMNIYSTNERERILMVLLM